MEERHILGNSGKRCHYILGLSKGVGGVIVSLEVVKGEGGGDILS